MAISAVALDISGDPLASLTPAVTLPKPLTGQQIIAKEKKLQAKIEKKMSKEGKQFDEALKREAKEIQSLKDERNKCTSDCNATTFKMLSRAQEKIDKLALKVAETTKASATVEMKLADAKFAFKAAKADLKSKDSALKILIQQSIQQQTQQAAGAVAGLVNANSSSQTPPVNGSSSFLEAELAFRQVPAAAPSAAGNNTAPTSSSVVSGAQTAVQGANAVTNATNAPGNAITGQQLSATAAVAQAKVDVENAKLQALEAERSLNKLKVESDDLKDKIDRLTTRKRSLIAEQTIVKEKAAKLDSTCVPECKKSYKKQRDAIRERYNKLRREFKEQQRRNKDIAKAAVEGLKAVAKQGIALQEKLKQATKHGGTVVEKETKKIQQALVKTGKKFTRQLKVLFKTLGKKWEKLTTAMNKLKKSASKLASELPTIRHKGLLATVGKLKTQLEAMVAEIAASRKNFDALRARRASVTAPGTPEQQLKTAHKLGFDGESFEKQINHLIRKVHQLSAKTMSAIASAKELNSKKKLKKMKKSGKAGQKKYKGPEMIKKLGKKLTGTINKLFTDPNKMGPVKVHMDDGKSVPVSSNDVFPFGNYLAVDPPEPVDVNTGALGITGEESLDPHDLHSAKILHLNLGKHHENFVKQHEKDCKGTLCPQ